jgi:hypothetical protein
LIVINDSHACACRVDQLGRLDGPQSGAAARRLTELALVRNETEAYNEIDGGYINQR